MEGKKRAVKNQAVISIFCLSFMLKLLSPAMAQEVAIEEIGELSLSDLLNLDVVSATKTPRKIKNAPSIVNVYTSEDIRNMGFRTLTDLLWTVAGVQVVQTANRRAKVWFRGAQSSFNNKTAMFVDGVPYRDGFGSYNIDWSLPLKQVTKVEIIRGPGSLLYGGNAFSGVINIFTRKPGERANEGDVEVARGAFDTQMLNVSVDKTADFGSLLMDAVFYDSDGQVPLRDRDSVINTAGAAQSTRNLNVKGAFLDERLQLNVAQHRFDNLNVSKGMNRPSPREYTRTSYDIQYRQDLAKPGAEMHFYVHRIVQSRRERDRRLERAKEELYFDKTTITDASAMLTYPLFPHNELVAGVTWQREKNNASDFSVINYVKYNPSDGVIDKSRKTIDTLVTNSKYIDFTTNNFAVYAQDTQDFRSGKTTMIAGLRLDVLDLFGSQLSYRLGLVNQFSDKIFAKALYGTAFRAPIFLEYSRAHKDGDLPEVANVELPKVEKITTVEFQLGYHDKANLHTLTVFQNEYVDYLSQIRNADDVTDWWDNPNAYWFEDYGSTGDLVMRGIEWESKIIVAANLNLFSNVSYLLNAKDRRTGKTLPLLANRTAAMGASWRPRYGPGSGLVSAYVTVYGQRKDWEAAQVKDSREANYGQLREDYFSEGFAIWNAKLGYQFEQGNWEGLDFVLEVKNILNVIYYSQGIETYNKQFDEKGQPNTFKPFFDTPYDERTVLFSMAYHW